MAVVHKLRRNVTDLNLNAGAGAGWRTTAWNPKVATPIYGQVPLPVMEGLDMIVEGSSHDNLAAHLQAMDEMQFLASAYMRDRTVQHPVWWHCKMNDETGERRALVQNIDLELRSPVVDLSGYGADNKTLARAMITRGPYWERTATVALPSATPAAAASVIWDYTASPGADVVGDVPARIQWLRLQSKVDSIDRFWLGLRSANKHGAAGLSSFENIWECEAGTLGTDAAVAGDGTASGGSKVTVTPGTATWAKRLTIAVDDVVGALIDEQYGYFLWLLRSQVSAGTWEVQLRWGYTGWSDDSYIRGPIVEVDGTAWNYFEMGQKPFPLRDLHALPLVIVSEAVEQYATIQIWARRTDGAGTLDLDCKCPVPIDEGFLKISGADLATDETFSLGCSPEGTFGGICVNTADFPRVEAHDFYLPVGDGRMVIVYARAASSVLADTIYVGPGDGYYYPRWLSLRGTE